MKEQKKEKVFIDGMIYKGPREGAPSFVKGSLAIKVNELTEFMKKHHKNGWVNIDLLLSASGNYYASLNTWEPKPKDSDNVIDVNYPKEESKEEGVNVDDIPF